MKNRFKLKSCFIFALILALIISTMPVMAFAETTDQWVAKAPMSTPRQKVKAEAVNGKIYAIGGVNEKGVSQDVEEYDPNGNIWTKKQQIPTPKQDFETAVLNEKIYVIGGMDKNNAYDDSVLEYDPKTDEWTTKAPLNVSRIDFTTAVVDGEIYAIGGVNNVSVTNAVEVYDPTKDTWTLKKSLYYGRRGIHAEVIDGKIYAIGGYNSGKELSYLEVYDPSTDNWTTKKEMLTPRWRFQTKVLNGKIYAMGGQTSTSNEKINTNKVESYDPSTDIWTQKSPMETQRVIFQTEILANNIYAIGNYATGTTSVEKYDPSSDKWDYTSSMLNSKIDHETIVLNGRIYAIGGSSNGQAIASVEEYTPVSSQPDAPTTLTATAGDKQVSLSWSPVTGAAGYNIYRSTTSGGNYTKIASDVTSTTYTDTGLTNGVTYYYYVTAIDSSGTESQPSNEASATPTAPSSGGYNATLKITMVTGEIKEYNVNSTVVESFISWFNSKGSESLVFTFEKTSDLGPYTSHTDYLAYDKISSFIVLKY